MPSKSFYDLDYIIELNEKRISDLNNVYQKVQEKLTTIILIYSALAIFLIPIIQDIFWKEVTEWLFYISFAAFAALFATSLVFTIRLMIPVKMAYLDTPDKYYTQLRIDYEQRKKTKVEIVKLLKASYITELESTLTTNNTVFRKKKSFYYNALIYSLLSVIPYLFCLAFHVKQKDDKVHKVEIVTSGKKIKLHKIDTMPNNSDKKTSTTTTTTTTRLPGVNNTDIIKSSPILIKENSHSPSVKKK